MVQLSVIGCFIACSLLVNCAFGLEKNQTENDDQKTVKKRGIIHLGVHPHFHHVPHVQHVPHIHFPKIPVITKIPIAPTVIAKPILPPATFLPAPIPVTPPLLPAPVTPYHITPGDAIVTSFSANYPRFPIFTKTIVPAVLPSPHHHHHFDPHFHIAPKPIVPVAVPFPGIRQPKIPIFINPNPIKPILYNPIKPHFHPVVPPFTPTPTFVPIPIPSNPPTTINTPLQGISTSNNLLSTTQETQKSEQEHTASMVPQGSWQPIVMLTKPSQQQISFIDKKKYSTPFNYHASLLQNIPSNNLISGQGAVSSQLAQQLALYQNHHQHLLNEHQDSFPYPPATYQAEKFTQNYDLPSNDGSFNGLSSYQVPLHQ